MQILFWWGLYCLVVSICISCHIFIYAYPIHSKSIKYSQAFTPTDFLSNRWSRHNWAQRPIGLLNNNIYIVFI